MKLGEICNEVRTTTKDPLADGLEYYIGLEHLDSGSLKIKRWGLIIEDKPSFTRVFKKGQILFGKRRPYLKKAAIAEFDGICSSDILVLEATHALETPQLLPFIIQSEKLWSHAIKTSSGSLSPRTKWKVLANQEFIVPTILKQHSLLKILLKIESIVEQTHFITDSLNSIIESLIQNTLLCPEKIKRSSMTLKTACKSITNRVYPEDFNSDTKYVGFEHLSSGNYYSMDYSGTEGVVSQKLSFKSGDILYGKIRPYLRKAALTDFEGICSSDLVVLRPTSDDYSLILAALFASEIFASLAMNTVKGTKMPRADWSLLEKTEIAKLNEKELQEFNTSILAHCKSLECLKQKYLHLTSLRKEIISVV